jgi:hypothetical protein
MGIQATLQEKQKNDRKLPKRCVRNDLEDFDGYSGDIRREAEEHEKAPSNVVYATILTGIQATLQEKQKNKQNTKTLCTQRFGIC